MTSRRRVALLILIMASVSTLVGAVTVTLLYRAALSEQRARLVETAKSQARLIEAIARFDAEYSHDHPEGPEGATLAQIIDAHQRYQGFGETGEFTLSKRVGDEMVFLLSHRHYDLDNPKPVPLSSNLAEPMRRALSGHSGTLIGLDYRGVKVLAAHEPVDILDLGIVAKIDLAEVRAPFIRSMVVSLVVGIVLVSAGAAVFVKITNPLIQGLHDTVEALQGALKQVKTLRGMLPICSSCKSIRDDKGYWRQIETYVRRHSEAEFSHGLCPSCAATLYPDLVEGQQENGESTPTKMPPKD